MRLALRVALGAEREIRKAAAWWRANRGAAPDLFRQELARVFDLITTEPGVGLPAQGSDHAGVRRVHLSRIHYYLPYRIHGDTVQVLGLWHTSRDTAARP